MPNGKTKPGESTGKAEEGYFPFEPDTDKFTADALLDLRSLNEKTAGQAGFIKRQGMGFTTGDGKPVRFWAVNVNASNAGQDREAVDYLARKLAKLGVNMVRYHSAAFDRNDPSKVDAKALDDLLYLVSAMKKQGIYTYLSFYFPLWMEANKPGAQLAGYESLANKRPFGLLFFDPRMQEMHRTWLRGAAGDEEPAHEPAAGSRPGRGDGGDSERGLAVLLDVHEEEHPRRQVGGPGAAVRAVARRRGTGRWRRRWPRGAGRRCRATGRTARPCSRRST